MREQMYKKVCMLGFVLVDTNLYLDTHPDDRAALNFYNKYLSVYKQAVSEYEAKFGPLTAMSPTCEDHWEWATGPWPWQKGAM